MFPSAVDWIKKRSGSPLPTNRAPTWRIAIKFRTNLSDYSFMRWSKSIIRRTERDLNPIMGYVERPSIWSCHRRWTNVQCYSSSHAYIGVLILVLYELRKMDIANIMLAYAEDKAGWIDTIFLEFKPSGRVFSSDEMYAHFSIIENEIWEDDWKRNKRYNYNILIFNSIGITWQLIRTKCVKSLINPNIFQINSFLFFFPLCLTNVYIGLFTFAISSKT